ncbi:eukaryotic elongation factor 2 kinase-like [Pteropus vampyrus]|uniref:Eukaryotic elongation factor 2 kinase-like n=1 Tax=Pteropus vampyrus TaxID=132908 RepID=A0A6P3S695_PTEVA|nr:eukaryotic elongation factor 2 kinase-like [Pteropus vampyrus]
MQRLSALGLEKRVGKSVLGKVHLAMVRYHEAGRFCQKGEAWDRVSAVFHLQHAADLGELEAVVGLGLMCSRLPHHILPDVSLQVSRPGPGQERPRRPPPPPQRPTRCGRGAGGQGRGCMGSRGRDGAIGPARPPECRLLLGGVARPCRAVAPA